MPSEHTAADCLGLAIVGRAIFFGSGIRLVAPMIAALVAIATMPRGPVCLIQLLSFCTHTSEIRVQKSLVLRFLRDTQAIERAGYASAEDFFDCGGLDVDAKESRRL